MALLAVDGIDDSDGVDVRRLNSSFCERVKAMIPQTPAGHDNLGGTSGRIAKVHHDDETISLVLHVANTGTDLIRNRKSQLLCVFGELGERLAGAPTRRRLQSTPEDSLKKSLDSHVIEFDLRLHAIRRLQLCIQFNLCGYITKRNGEKQVISALDLDYLKSITVPYYYYYYYY